MAWVASYDKKKYKYDQTKQLLELCKDACKAELGQFEYLLKNGADPNSGDLGDSTPLMWASYCGNNEVVKLLLHYKADLHMTNEYGESPLHKACSRGYVEVVRILIQAGASMDQKDITGKTALHKACYNGHVKVVRTLIQVGASLDQKDKRGWTPLDWARERGCSDIVALLKEGAFSNKVSQSEGDGEEALPHEQTREDQTTSSSQGTPKEFILPELSTPIGYKCVTRGALGLVYLPSTSNQTVSIEPVTDAKFHPYLESNEILLTPVVSLCPQDVTLDRNQLAIIELTKSVEPTDLNRKTQLVPIYSCIRSLQWEELVSHDCEMLPDRIRFKTTRFGYHSLKIHFSFPSASTTIDPNMQQPAEIEIKELPGFKVEIPPASVQSATKITATVLYENPHVIEHFKGHSLASTCVRLEPHTIQFEEEVKVTLPIPNYNRIKQKYPEIKLEVWLSNSSHEGVPIAWEPTHFTTYIDESGNCLATAYITHFSYIGAVWNSAIIGIFMNFFTARVRDRCQVFMSPEKRIESLLTFGIAVLLYPFNEPCQGLPNYPYLLFDSVRPIDVAVGDVECQVDLNEIILRTFSINRKQKSHKESVHMSRDGDMRAEFSMELSSDATSAELPAGTTVATLLIKHGSEKNRPHKFTLIKPLETAVDQAKEIPPCLATVKTATKQPLESSVDSAKDCLDAIEKAAHGLTKTTKELKQNVLTLSAQRIAEHMQKVTRLACHTSGFAKGDEITDIMQLIVKESEEIEELSEQIAQACIESRLKQNLQAEVTKIPALSKPLKFAITKIKQKQYGKEAEQEAIDLLTTNATNLRSVVEAVLYAADRAIIKVPLSELERFVPKGMLNIDDLHKVQDATWEVRAKWYNCGLALGLTAGTLDAIEKTRRGSCDDCYTDVLKEWLQTAYPQPTWSTLCSALKQTSVGHEELAEKLSKQH